jgi:hypothetical protein
MDLLAAPAEHLNGKSGPDVVLEATEIGGQIFCVQHGFRSQIEVAADLIPDGTTVAYVEIEPHARLLSPAIGDD